MEYKESLGSFILEKTLLSFRTLGAKAYSGWIHETGMEKVIKVKGCKFLSYEKAKDF